MLPYLLQRGDPKPKTQAGDGIPPKVISQLPADIPDNKQGVWRQGAWQYTYTLQGWIGFNLSDAEVRRLYNEKIGAQAV